MDVTSCFDLWPGIQNCLGQLQTVKAQFMGLAFLMIALFETMVALVRP